MAKSNSKNRFRILAQFTTGIFGGTLLGIISFIVLMTIGGKYGCLPIIDKLTGLQGYESCGNFGGTFGIILGSLIGLFFIKLSKRSESLYKKIAITTAIAALIGPILIGVGITGVSSISDYEYMSTISGITMAVILSSAIVTLAIAFVIFVISKVVRFFKKQ